MMCYSVMTQAYSEKEIPSSPNRSRTYDLPITSSDALPLSYRRLVGAKAIKLGSWDKHCIALHCIVLCCWVVMSKSVIFFHFPLVIKMDRKLPGDGGLTFPDFSNPKIDRWDARHDVIALPSSVFDRSKQQAA